MVDSPTQELFGSKMKLKKFLMQSKEEIADLLRTIDNPKRLEILSLMIDGATITFRELLEETDLQKSALANHLSSLTDKNLIEKYEKGVYQITLDGTGLLERIAQSYLEGKLREQERLERLLRMLGEKPQHKYKEEKLMETDNKAKIVQLQSMRIVSFHVTESETPENESWKKLEAWAKPKGLFDNPTKNIIYGFNNPDPTKESKTYGYEFWITLDEDFEVDEEITIKTFSGGLYAVMACRGVENISPTWKKLVDWIKNSKYQFAKHQWLEHHIDPNITDHNKILFDLYAPIKE
ncbi:MAG: effector binding domain-containing protein [Candidatus Hodarchaeales archaeon]|jgi:DNA gyrase inhibitor GyrI/DNA-binding transcriptional ArsR family regulator